ncbi:ankyrin repeat-containing domain protein [Aspergillus unguis]
MPSPTSLSTLPSELLLTVADHLDYTSDILYLSLANRRLYNELNSLIYTRDARLEDSYALQWAAKSGNETVVRNALNAGAKPTPELLALAVYHGQESIVKLLSEEQVDINALLDGAKTILFVDHQLSTALATAATRGRESMVRLLLGLGAHIDKPAPSPVRTMRGVAVPLTAAAAEGHLEIVRLLLDAGGQVDFPDNSQRPALYHAASNGHLEVVKLLLERGANPTPSGFVRRYPSLVAAVVNGHVEVARVLVDHGARPSHWIVWEEALHENPDMADFLLREMRYPKAATGPEELNRVAYHAAASGLIDIVTECLAQGWNVNSQLTRHYEQDEVVSTTALEMAADRGQVDIVRLLLCHGADPNLPVEDTPESRWLVGPLLHAVSKGQDEIFDLLLEQGARITHGRDLLFDAARKGFAYIFGRLLDLGATCEAYIFSMAASKGTANIQMLIDRGFDMNDHCRDETYQGLFEVLTPDHDTILDILLANGFDPRPGSPEDHRNIMNAVHNVNPRLLKLMINNGYKIHEPDTQSYMIYYAANTSTWDGATEMIDFLLQQGLEIDAVSQVGRTPLILSITIAPTNNQSHAVRILLERGANPCFYVAERKECALSVAAKGRGRGPLPDIIETLLEFIDQNDAIPFSVVGPQLLQALSVVEKPELDEEFRARRLLHEYYWKRRNQALNHLHGQ